MAQNIEGASLQPIYKRLNEAPEFHPLEAETFADWAMEAGDIVTVTRDGKSYQSPVHSSTVKWRKGQQVTISSTGNEKRDAISRMSQKKYNKGSGSLRGSNEIHHQIFDEDGHVQVTIDVTASNIRTEVSEKYEGLSSTIEQTASSIRSEVSSSYAGLSSTITQTASSIRSEVSSSYEGLSSTITQTASSIRSEVSSSYEGLSSTITQTASSIRSEVSSSYAGLTSTITQTASSIRSEVSSSYAGLTSTITQTASSIRSEVSSSYEGLSSTITQTASSIRSEVSSSYAGLTSTITQTASSIRSEVSSSYAGLTSTITQTASSIRSEVSSSYAGLTSTITQTASSIRSEVSSSYAGLTSTITQTASSIRSEVSSSYAGLSSTIEQTASSIKLYAGSAENAASIVLAINGSSGESEIKLSSDRVYIGNSKSTTVINGKCSLSDVTADYIKGKIESVNLLNVQAIAGTNGQAYCYLNEFKGNYYKVNISGGGGSSSTLDLVDGVFDVQVVWDSNTSKYKLQKRNIKTTTWTDAGSFERAVTKVTGVWSGSGKLTVKADATSGAELPYETLLSSGAAENEDGTPYEDGDTWYIPVKYSYGPNQQYSEPTGFRVGVNAYHRWLSGYNTGYTYGKVDGFNSVAAPTFSWSNPTIRPSELPQGSNSIVASIADKSDGTHRATSRQLTLAPSSSWANGIKTVYLQDSGGLHAYVDIAITDADISASSDSSGDSSSAHQDYTLIRSATQTSGVVYYPIAVTAGGFTKNFDFKVDASQTWNAGYGAAGVSISRTNNVLSVTKAEATKKSVTFTLGTSFSSTSNMYYIDTYYLQDNAQTATTVSRKQYTLDYDSSSYSRGTLVQMKSAGSVISGTAVLALSAYWDAAIRTVTVNIPYATGGEVPADQTRPSISVKATTNISGKESSARTYSMTTKKYSYVEDGQTKEEWGVNLLEHGDDPNPVVVGRLNVQGVFELGQADAMSHSITIPDSGIDTRSTTPPTNWTNLTKLKTKYEAAKADSDFVFFTVYFNGKSRTFYMEP